MEKWKDRLFKKGKGGQNIILKDILKTNFLAKILNKAKILGWKERFMRGKNSTVGVIIISFVPGGKNTRTVVKENKE